MSGQTVVSVSLASSAHREELGVILLHSAAKVGEDGVERTNVVG